MAVKATSTTDPRKEQQHDSNLKRGSNKVEPPNDHDITEEVDAYIKHLQTSYSSDIMSAARINYLSKIYRDQLEAKLPGISAEEQVNDISLREEAGRIAKTMTEHDLGKAYEEAGLPGRTFEDREILRKYRNGDLKRPSALEIAKANKYHKRSTIPFAPMKDGGSGKTGSTSTTNSPEDNDLAFYDSSSPLPFAFDPLEDSNTNQREDNDANNNDANNNDAKRTSRNGSDDERSAEVEDNENNSTTEEEYDNHNNFNNDFLPSLLSCLLLHQNHRGESSDYNSFLSSSVNMRKYLNVEKLLPDITDETRNKSLVSRTMEANDMTTPLDGRYNVVLVSYDKLGEEEKSAAVLYPTYSGAPLSEENGSKYKAIPPSPETLLKGLEWLCNPQSPVAATNKERMERLLDKPWTDVSEDPGNKFILELSQMYVERLYQLAPTNQTWESLREFIDDRDWTGDHDVWGGQKQAFLEETDRIQDDHEKWTTLRNYVCCNMAWMTGLIILPADSLHRSATADCILRGHPPPEADDVLRNKVQEYWRNIVPDEGLLVDRKQKGSGQKKKKESKIILTCIVPEKIDSSFMLKMRGISAMAQDKGEHGSEHTMIHMLNAVGEHVSEKLEHRYLIWNGDKTHGLSRVLRMLSEPDRKEEFMTILVEDGLCHDRSEAVNICHNIEEQVKRDDAKRRRVESTWNDNKETSGLSVSNLAEIYVRFWTKKFIKTVYESVNHFVKNHRTIVDIDDEVGLGDIAKMTESEFSNIFRRKINDEEDYNWTINPYSMKDKGTTNSSLWNGTVTKPFLMYGTRGYPNVGTGSSDPFDSSVVKIPTEKGDEIFRHQLVDFVWLLFLSNLSPVCHGSLVKYFSDAPCSNRLKQRGSSKGGRARARVNVRCLTLTISHAAQAGKALYNVSYFGSSKQSQTKPDKMGKICQDVLFLISAVTHTCPTFCDLGQNPDPPRWATPVPSDPTIPRLLSILRKRNWKIGNRISENYVCLVTFAFCLYMHDHSNDVMEPTRRSTNAKKCQKLVCASLARDCGKAEVPSTKSIGMWSSDGTRNLDMTPNSSEIPHFGILPEPHPRLETIIQVLRKTHECSGRGTQRISEFISDCLDRDKIWFAIQDKADQAVNAQKKRATDKANSTGNTQQKDGVAGMVGGDAVEDGEGEQIEQTGRMSAGLILREEEDQTQGAVGRDEDEIEKSTEGRDEDKIEKSAEGRDKKSRKRRNSSRSPAKKSKKRRKHHVAAILKLEEDVMNHKVVKDLVEDNPDCAELTGGDLKEYIHTNMNNEEEWKWIMAETVQTFVENKRADNKQKKEADADMTHVLTDDISETSASDRPRNEFIEYEAGVSGSYASPDENEQGPNSYEDDSFIDNDTVLDGSGYDADKHNAQPLGAPRGKTLTESPSRGKVFNPDHANNGSSSSGEAEEEYSTLRVLGRGKLPRGKQLSPTAHHSSRSSGEMEEEENTSHDGGTTKEDNSKDERRSSSPNGEEPGKSASSSDNEVDTKDTSSNVEEDTSNVQWAAENADTASQGSISPDFGLVEALERTNPNGLYQGQGEENYGFW